jgi:hypothetical protein
MALTKVRGSLIDMADLDLSNVGALQVDSIAGDADSNTSITFSGSDVITIATGGSGRLTIGDGALSPVSDSQIDLGTSNLEFKDAFFDGTVTSDAFAGPLTGAVTGNADTATTLATARTIGGVSFDGSANIAVTLAATATALATGRTIGGTSFDGTANIAVATATEGTNVTVVANNSTDETVYPTFVDGATGTQGIETDTGLTYNPSSGLLTTTTVAAALTGNASTATALANARTIGGVSFDGTANIAVTLAATATALASARTIGGTSFDGTANIVPGTATVATTVTITDNANTAETNAIIFTAGGDLNGGDIGLESDGTSLTYNPNTGQLTATELSATTFDIGGTNISATAAELNYVDGVTSAIQTQMDTKASTGKAIAMALVFG